MGLLLDAAIIAANVAALASTALATGYRIDEAIGDYGRAIGDIEAQILETATERDRRIATEKETGILGIREIAGRAGYEARMGMTQAEMVASAAEHRLGVSGMRMHGSPLMAAQQQVDLAFAAADRTIEAGRAAVKMGGLKLKTGLEDIGAQASLMTAAYQRQKTEMAFKQSELAQNKWKMVLWAGLGGLPGVASSFYELGSRRTSTSTGFFTKGLSIDY